MPRPKHENPTPAELRVLHALWEHGPMTVRQVMAKLEESSDAQDRAYTTVMSLMNVMFEKGLLARKPEGRAFIYEPAVSRDYRAAVLEPDWHYVRNPYKIVVGLADLLRQRGGTILKEEVKDFERASDGVRSVVTDRGKYE